MKILVALFILTATMTSSLVEGSGRSGDERNREKITPNKVYPTSMQEKEYRSSVASNTTEAEEQPKRQRETISEKEKAPSLEHTEPSHIAQYNSKHSLELRSSESSEKEKAASMEHSEPSHIAQYNNREYLEKWRKAWSDRMEPLHMMQLKGDVSSEKEETAYQRQTRGAGDLFGKMSKGLRSNKTAEMERMGSLNTLQHSGVFGRINTFPKSDSDILEKEKTAHQGRTKGDDDPLDNTPEPSQFSEQEKTSYPISSKEPKIVDVDESPSHQLGPGRYPDPGPLVFPVSHVNSLHTDITSRHRDDIYDPGHSFLEPMQFESYDSDYIQITDSSGSIWGSESAVALPDIPDGTRGRPRSPSPSPIPHQEIMSPKPQEYEYTDHEPANKRTNYSTMFRDPNDEHNYKRFKDNSG